MILQSVNKLRSQHLDHDIYLNIIRISYIDVEFGKILCVLGKYYVKVLFKNGPSTTD